MIQRLDQQLQVHPDDGLREGALARAVDRFIEAEAEVRCRFRDFWMNRWSEGSSERWSSRSRHGFDGQLSP